MLLDNPLCSGDDGFISLVVSGGTPGYSYLWSNGDTLPFTAGGAGTYSVTITDAAGCIINGGPYTITEPFSLSGAVTVTEESAPGASDGTATVSASGGTSPYTFSWSTGGTTSTITGLAPGTYCCTVTDANGCDTTFCNDVITGIGAASMQDPITIGVFPNPNTGNFHVYINTLEPTAMSVQIVDRLGRVIWSNEVDNSTSFKGEVSLEGAADGIYFMRANALGQQMVRKIVVKH